MNININKLEQRLRDTMPSFRVPICSLRDAECWAERVQFIGEFLEDQAKENQGCFDVDEFYYNTGLVEYWDYMSDYMQKVEEG